MPRLIAQILFVALGVTTLAANADPPRKQAKADGRLVEVLVVGSGVPTPRLPEPVFRDLEIVEGDTFDTKPLLDMIGLRIRQLRVCTAQLGNTRPKDASEVEVEFTIMSSGVVAEIAFVDSATSTEPLRPCIERMVRGLRVLKGLPKTRSRVRLAIAFVAASSVPKK